MFKFPLGPSAVLIVNRYTLYSGMISLRNYIYSQRLNVVKESVYKRSERNSGEVKFHTVVKSALLFQFGLNFITKVARKRVKSFVFVTFKQGEVFLWKFRNGLKSPSVNLTEVKSHPK